MSSRRPLCGLLLICASLGSAVARLSAQTPTAECSIPTSPGGKSASAPAVVSGVDYVRLTFALRTNGSRLDEPRFAVGDGPASTVRITVWRIEDGRRDGVDHVLEQAGGGQSGSRFFESLGLQIPVGDERRDRDIREYLDWVEATEGDDPRNAQTLARFRTQREAIVLGMRAVYFQNEAGLYAIECEYTETAPGTWQGTVKAPTLYVRVSDERFFDQPAYKRQPKAR